MEKSPTSKSPEKNRQQEFFATEAGAVAGRENMERLSRRVENMLNEGDGTIADIKKKFEEARERISSEEEGSERSDKATREYAFQNPDRDPKKQTEYVSWLNRSARERSEKLAARLAKLSEFSQKLEQGTFSTDDAKAAMEYLHVPDGEERMAFQIFLGRANEAKRKRKEEESLDGSLERPGLSPDDLRSAIEEEQAIVDQAYERVGDDTQQNRYAEKIDFLNNAFAEVDEFEARQKNDPHEGWEEYLSEKYKDLFKELQKAPEGRAKKDLEARLAFNQRLSREFSPSTIELRRGIRGTEQKDKPSPDHTPKQETQKPQERIREILRAYAKPEEGRVNPFTVAIEGFARAYPDETDRVERIGTLMELYSKKLEEQLKLHPNPTGQSMRASNEAMRYIVESVLITPEKNAFKQAAQEEQERMSSKKGVKIVISVPLENSLRELFLEVEKGE